MSEFREFEKRAIRFLVGDELPAELVSLVCGGTLPLTCEFTGAGYYLTLSHPLLPSDRLVLSYPPVLGTHQRVDCGFVVFLGEHELTLECHSFGLDVPEDIRDLPIEVRVSDQVL